MSKGILEFSKTATPIETRTQDEIGDQLAASESAYGSLLGVEREAKRTLEDQMRRLRHDRVFMDSGYSRLNMEPLGWTRGGVGGFGGSIRPVFAVYTLTNPVMTIRSAAGVRENGGFFLDHEPGHPSGLPAEIRDCFLPVHRQIHERIRSTFVGVIPPEAKAAIKTATPFFQPNEKASPDIFIIAEGQWVVDREAIPAKPRRLDPLVVGWDGMDLWLITHFDLTNIEAYVLREFPALPAGPVQLKLSS